MKPPAKGWLFEGDAREEVERAISECVQEHGGALTGDPTVMKRTLVRDDGSTFPATVLIVQAEADGWWEEYARVHSWPQFSKARMKDLFGKTPK